MLYPEPQHIVSSVSVVFFITFDIPSFARVVSFVCYNIRPGSLPGFFIFKINFNNYLELSSTSVYICGMATKNTRIDASVLERVNDHVELSGQPASLFISIAATQMLDTIQGKQSVKTKYFSEMGDFLMKELNKKKK